MNVETELRDQINREIPELSGRVYPMKLPQNATFPAVRYNRISAVRGYTMNGPDCLPAARFQIDTFDRTWDDVRVTWDKIRKSLDGFSGGIIQDIMLDNETDDYDDELQLFRVIGDFVVQYTETF